MPRPPVQPEQSDHRVRCLGHAECRVLAGAAAHRDRAAAERETRPDLVQLLERECVGGELPAEVGRDHARRGVRGQHPARQYRGPLWRPCHRGPDSVRRRDSYREHIVYARGRDGFVGREQSSGLHADPDNARTRSGQEKR